MRRILAYIVFISIYSISANAQIQRAAAMGGLSYSIIDKDLSLSLYDFGGNPAWLYVEEQQDYLKVEPSFGSRWGDYRRKYDADRINNYDISFAGVKTLGSKGTFYGLTEYNYELRKDYYYTVRKDPYRGDGFNIVDTSTGDFRYNGPIVKLMYSWELLHNLFAGGYGFYRMQDGLKKNYAYAKTIYRNAGGGLGLAYRFSDSLAVGVSLDYYNEQEAIESEDINLLDVEIHIYRGETYFITKKSSSEEQKIKGEGFSLSGQMFWNAGNNIQVGFQANYKPSTSKLLIPNAQTDELESEDCYANFESYDAQLRLQYNTDDFVLGFYGGYFHDDAWTRITNKDVLMWDWNIDRATAGIGSSYKVLKNLLVGAEYQFSGFDVDSTKYIDLKHTEFSSTAHSFKLGLEYEVRNGVFLRTGYNYGFDEHDIISGGDDVSFNSYSLGIGYYLFGQFAVDAHVNYSGHSPAGNIKRSDMNGVITLTFNSF